MPRPVLAFGLGCCLLLVVGGLGSITRVRATQSPNEFWRLPWKATVAHSVSGFGYGEGTHDGISPHAPEDRWALDFAAVEGEYLVAAQEGTVGPIEDKISSCGDGLHYGNYVDVTDIGNYVHRYAHLQVPLVAQGDHVVPGQIIGRAGHTGNVSPCDVTGAPPALQDHRP